VPLPVSPTLVLSPSATVSTLLHKPVSALMAQFWFAGNARDDPGVPDGLCYSHETVPATWSVSLGAGGSLTMANGAPGEGGHFYSCHGDLHSQASPNLIGG
jgi:hypothetical protein